jgi:predicted MFS family arabinose efflux permease
MASAAASRTEPQQEPSVSRGGVGPGIVITILFLVFFLGMSDNQMVSPLLPLMAKEFHLPDGDIGKMIAPAYAFAAAIAALIVGPASDRLGRRRFLLCASIVFGLSLISVGLISDLKTLTAVRFFTGLAAGTFSTCSIAYVGDYFPYSKRGSAMSIVQAGYFVALVVGVPLGSLLAERKGWRSGFLAFGSLAVAVFLLVLFLLPEDKHKAAPQTAASAGRLKDIGLIFQTKERIAAIAGAFFVSAGFVGFILYMGSWLTHTHGLSTAQVGLVFAVVGVSSLIGAIVAGPIADKVGKRGVSLISTIILAITLALIPVLHWGALLFATFLIASLSYAFRQGPIQALATELVPRRARGSLVAARTTTSQLGIGVSTAACGFLYDSRGYSAVGLFCAVITLAAAICIFMMREPANRCADEW